MVTNRSYRMLLLPILAPRDTHCHVARRVADHVLSARHLHTTRRLGKPKQTPLAAGSSIVMATPPGRGHKSCRWGGSHLPVPRKGTWLMKRCGPSHVLLTVWMGCPNQTGGLQGRPGVSLGGLAGNDSGTGPGWQQSRQN